MVDFLLVQHVIKMLSLVLTIEELRVKIYRNRRL